MASSQPSQNVELEAAKFLQKLIHDSKDEPSKLATKLFVILQHMRSSGKEHSMPYQVISRAMETVISQHNLDVEALMSSRLPPSSGGQGGDSVASSQYAGSSQAGGVGTDSKGPYAGNDPSKVDQFSSNRPPVGPGTGSHDYYQGSGANRSNQSFDHESPSSLDTKSANSQSQERGQKSKDSKKGASKRKRGDSSLASESHIDSSQQLDGRKGKLNKTPGGLPVKGSENASFGIVSAGGQPEASSVHAPAVQQGGSLLSTHESLSSRVSWNQSRAGLPLEKSQVPRFPGNSISGNMMTEMPSQQSTVSSLGSNFFGSFGKIPGGMLATSDSRVMGDTSFLQFGASDPQKNGIGKSVASPSDKAVEIQSFPANRVDDLHPSIYSSKVSEQDGGNSTVFAEANSSIQGVRQNNSLDTVIARTSAPRDLGKSPVSQNHLPSGMPFKEHQLKQLRAQCLVFLAFRNGLIPKKLHLEVALGSLLPKEGASSDGRKEMVEQKGKAQSSAELPAISDVPMAFGRQNNPKETDRVLPVAPSSGRLQDGTSLSNQDDQLKLIGSKIAQPPNFSAVADERQHLSAANSMERVRQGQETMESDLFAMTALQQPNFAGNVGILGSNNLTAFTGNGHIHGGRVDQASPSMRMKTQHQLLPDRKDDGSSHFQGSGNIVFPEHDDDENSASGDSFPSPRYTMSEKWITDVQRKKIFAQQNLLLKQQTTKQRIAIRFEKLKEVVSLSEDLSAKTKSVIELKKLQLLELQHRLRSEFLGDFFKPITADMDRLKSYKKNKHGRRTRQLEKFEQKMKEERQKRIRERQKEFFAEIEVHKEKLDDVFKIKKERWKGFNRYVKEFHKRKERIHREKIDRIQREKINLLKINDVEGYLRMVQDAKSDRVKQLLKETEKYLQKLGSKLRDAKVVASRFENDTDETRTTALLEKNETSFENEDESDQAKHYLESNEKYYLMAHSIKESIAEQPASLVGGKLREYQMNGLRWLVSLYNNHLNGILADEMGLGKTVQVISLICYLMETKNDRGPFLVVVPSSVLPGWDSEINFWAPGIHKIVYSGPPEERRRLFKEQIVHQKFNVLLTTYEYLMNKHDRPKLSKVHWHYIIIDEGHRIKNASCKLNADLKHYQSSHRLLLTGTPLQNNLEELWALLNFLLPNIFNSSEDFSQWFNKPFEGNGDSSADEALLSEEENLLIINRLHQVLRPFVLRRLKHKVENELPEKIERLIRCEASAYQKLLMKRVEDNLGSIGNPKARSVHNSVMELRNICNHPYLSQLHSDEVDNMVPRHFLPNIIRHCGKLEMLDRLLPKLKATDHRVLFFSTMTRLLDIMEEYLTWKQYRYLRLDGHTSGGDRGALIDQFNKSNSPYFIFLLSIRAGGVGVNLQAADTVIIFDTDWNPQVDLQAQARAHRIGQKRDVLVLRFETVKTVEEQVRASAEHKLGVANQSITAGFFDNNTSAEDRREYLEALLRECKKEEAAPVLDDDALNDLIARSESEIDIFESIDKRRLETETGIWKQLLKDRGLEISDSAPSLPSRLVTDDDLKAFYEVVKLYDVPKTAESSNVGIKRKGQYIGGTDTQHYGRGKRAREVRSYEEQWTEEEFEKLCQADSPGSPSLKDEARERNLTKDAEGSMDRHAPFPVATHLMEPPAHVKEPPAHIKEPPAHVKEPPAHLVEPPAHLVEPPAPPRIEEVAPPPKRGRGRPRRVAIDKPLTAVVVSAPPAAGKTDGELLKGTEHSSLNAQPSSSDVGGNGGLMPQPGAAIAPVPQPVAASVNAFGSNVTAAQSSVPMVSRGRGRKVHEEISAPRRRGRKPGPAPAVGSMVVPNPNSVNQSMNTVGTMPAIVMGGPVSGAPVVQHLANMPIAVPTEGNSGATRYYEASSAIVAVSPSIQYSASPAVLVENMESNQKIQCSGPPRRRGRKPMTVSPAVANISAAQLLDKTPQLQIESMNPSRSKYTLVGSNQENESRGISSEILAGQDKKSTDQLDDSLERQQVIIPTMHDVTVRSIGYSGSIQNSAVDVAGAVKTDISAENSSSRAKVTVLAGQEETGAGPGSVSTKSVIDFSTGSVSLDEVGKLVHEVPVEIVSGSQPISGFLHVSLASQSSPAESIQGKKQGRRASSGVEGPRRRGRRPGSASSKVEVSVGQDPKLNLQTHYKSRDASGSMTMSLRSRQETDPKMLANVVQESNSPGVVAQDLKRKEPGGTPTFGRLQTADVTGVARLMKEIFSETSAFKTKAGDSSKSDSRSTTHAALNKAPMEVRKSQTSEEKACPTSVPTLDAGVMVDGSGQSGTAISIDLDDGPPGFGSCNKKNSMSNAPLVSSPVVKSTSDCIVAVDPSGSRSGDSKSPTVQDLLISKSSFEPSPKESLESSRFSVTPDPADAVEVAGVDNAGESVPACSSACDLGSPRSPAVIKKDSTTESQPLPKESEESPATGVGTLKETSTASEISGDDPLVDVSASATKDADTGTVGSDLCPAEAITAEYTGEGAVGAAEAARDESEPPCTDNDDKRKSMPEPDNSVTSKSTAAELVDFCVLERQASVGIATASGYSSLKEDHKSVHQELHKGETEYNGSTEEADLSNSSSSLPQDITATSGGLQILEEKVCPVETKLSDGSMSELNDTQGECGQISSTLEDSTAHFCSALQNDRKDACQDDPEQNNVDPQVDDPIITDVDGSTLDVQQDGQPLPSVVMEENKVDSLSDEGPAGSVSALKQLSEAEITENGGLSQPSARPNHSVEDPSSSLMLEQENHRLQLDQGLCGSSDLAEEIEGFEAKEIGGTDTAQGNSSLDNALESLPLPSSCLVTVEDKGSVDKDSFCQSLVSEPEGLNAKDDGEIGLNDPSNNRIGLDEQKAQCSFEKGSICGSESLSTDSGNRGPKDSNQVGDLVSSLVSGSVVFSKPTSEIGENTNKGSLERDPPGSSGACGNMEGPDQLIVDNTCVSVSNRPVTGDASQTGDSVPQKSEIPPITSPFLMIESAMVEGSSEGAQPKMSDQMNAGNACISAMENSVGVVQPASLLEDTVTVNQLDKTRITIVQENLESPQAKVSDPTDTNNARVSEPENSVNLVQPTSTANIVIIENQTKGSETEVGDQLAMASTSVSEPEKLADTVQPAPILVECTNGINQTEVCETRETEGGVHACASEPESRSVNLVPPASVLEEQMIESQIGSPETARDESKNEMNLVDPCASQSENTSGGLVHLLPASEEVTEVQLEPSDTGKTELAVEMRVADPCVSDPENESCKMFLVASSEEQMNGSQTGGSGSDKTVLTSMPEDHQQGSSAEKESCEDLVSHTDEEEPEVPPDDDSGKGDICAVVPENREAGTASLDDESGNMDLPAPLSTVQKQSLVELHPNISGENTQHDEPVSGNIPDDLVSPSSAAATEEKINALFEDNLGSDANGSGNELGDHTHHGEENDVEPSPVVCPCEVDK